MVQEHTKRDFIIDLPHDLAFNISTPEYAGLGKMSVTRSTSAAGAVTQYLFREFKDPEVARRIAAAIRNHPGGYEACAHEVPEIVAEDGGKIPSHLFEIMQEGAMADELQEKQRGSPFAHSRELLAFYRDNRISQPQ
jgi:hypothetical protein